ncbi:hypothetical protein ACH4UT_10365 [Streptomyces sp. NPDC020799]|uniref:hypothetical protein n=1 Tax=Streptomyces sp. NPDC020799 TaxID=3365091 RepID=UPI003792930D
MPVKPSEGDAAMAARDFFSPAELLDFIDLPGLLVRETWGRDTLTARGDRFHVRRLEFELDPGCMATWTPSPLGFRYELAAPGGPRWNDFTWREVAARIHERLTPLRYGRLKGAVDALRAHERAYVPSCAPYRSVEVWASLSAEPWSRRQSELELSAAHAKDAILPAVQGHPALF